MGITQRIVFKNEALAAQFDKKLGESMEIAVDINGTPLDRYWRKRFKDCSTDGCIELVQDEKMETKAKKGAK